MLALPPPSPFFFFFLLCSAAIHHFPSLLPALFFPRCARSQHPVGHGRRRLCRVRLHPPPRRRSRRLFERQHRRFLHAGPRRVHRRVALVCPCRVRARGRRAGRLDWRRTVPFSMVPPSVMPASSVVHASCASLVRPLPRCECPTRRRLQHYCRFGRLNAWLPVHDRVLGRGAGGGDAVDGGVHVASPVDVWGCGAAHAAGGGGGSSCELGLCPRRCGRAGRGVGLSAPP